MVWEYIYLKESGSFIKMQGLLCIDRELSESFGVGCSERQEYTTVAVECL